MKAVERSILVVALLIIWSSPAAASVPAGEGISGLMETSEEKGIYASVGASYGDPGRSASVASPTGQSSHQVAVGVAGEVPPEPQVLVYRQSLRHGSGDIGGRDAIFDDNVSGCLLGFRPEQAPEPRDGRGPRGPQPPGPGRIIDRVIELVAAPELQIAPSEIGLTGLETYVWIEEPRPVGATAAAGGTTVEARAYPTQYLWDWGDGNDTLTYSSGRAWTEHSPGTIEHVYETIGRYDLSVEVVWEAQWRINGGGWRALGLFSLRDGVDYPVRQVQSRLTRSDG